MSRIGVFICWCGENIARTVDVEEVTKQVAQFPGVRCAVNYKYMCSDPGQAIVRDKIVSERLDGVVVACPMCHVNLDMKQGAVERRFGKKLGMVIYYLSDLVGLALGLPAEQLGINRHFVTQV